MLLSLLLSCLPEPSSDSVSKAWCSAQNDAPYTRTTPYLGIHGNAANNDIVPCHLSDEYTEDWHALQGYAITQPNTFSPDGSVTYVTTASPEENGCRIHALDVETGAVQWCLTEHRNVSYSSIEVDADGYLYYSAADRVVSLFVDGSERWATQLQTDQEIDATYGVHFTPAGDLATVTQSGHVFLLSRDNGLVLSSLSIPDTYGFVAPKKIEVNLDFASLVPESVSNDVNNTFGSPDEEESSAGFAEFLGGGGFCDNTLGISVDGDIYVIGGGEDDQNGALVQLHIENSATGPILTPGWVTTTVGGSASSPSITTDGRYVTIADGVSMLALLNPDMINAHVKRMDIHACDANTDADPNPEVCAVSLSEPNERAPMMGAPAIEEDGTVIFYELSLGFDAEESARDVVALGTDGVQWSVSLPHNRDWTSVVTVTDEHIVGTATAVIHSDSTLLGFQLPETTDNVLLMLDRTSGEVVFEAPIPDDSGASVSVGPDGSLYVGTLGMFTILATDKRPTLGLLRFVPE